MVMGIAPQMFAEKVLTDEENKIIHNRHHKVFICVNLETFFAQACSNKLSLDHSIPLITIEGGLCTSANYSALSQGITKGMSMDQAKALCPKVILCQADSFKTLGHEVGLSSTNTTESKSKSGSYQDKMVQEYYRAEWDRIFSIFRKRCSLIEKSPYEEAFLDITPEAYDFYRKGNYTFEWKAKMLGGDEFLPETEQEILIMIGSQIIERALKEVKETFNYTCSVGVSHNKMLSQTASRLSKASGQSIILERYVLDVLKPLEVGQIKSFGKHVIDTLVGAGCKKIEDVHRLAVTQLEAILKDERTAKLVYSRSRGIDEETIGENDLRTKSIMLQKSFGQAMNLPSLAENIDQATTEISAKISRFYDQHKMVPSLLSVRFYDNLLHIFRINSININLKKRKEEFQKYLKSMILETLSSVTAEVLFPCSQIGLIAKRFEKNALDSFEFDLVTYAKTKQREKEKEKKKQKEAELLVFENSLSQASTVLLEPSTTSASNMSMNSIGNSSSMTTCERCKCLVSEDSFASHSDFHIAEDMDKELNPNKKKYKRTYLQNDYKEELTSKNDETSQVKKKVKKETSKGKTSKQAQPTVTLDQFFLKK